MLCGFLTEAKSIAALNHPNIVQIHDYGRDEDGPFLIMEYVDGGSLLEKCKEGALELAEAVELISNAVWQFGIVKIVPGGRSRSTAVYVSCWPSFVNRSRCSQASTILMLLLTVSLDSGLPLIQASLKHR
jgi:hypothetical protein